jgi:hypothetical protein
MTREGNDARLDALLTGWAASQRLDDAEAADILHAVVATPRPVVAPAAGFATVAEADFAPAPEPAGLPATWWEYFSGRIADAMLRSSGVLVAA